LQAFLLTSIYSADYNKYLYFLLSTCCVIRFPFPAKTEVCRYLSLLYLFFGKGMLEGKGETEKGRERGRGRGKEEL
jgi:hypothetical protein